MSTRREPLAPVDVLIVEKDSGVRRNLRSALESRGYCCAEARNVREAAELLRQQPPRHLVIPLENDVAPNPAPARKLRGDGGSGSFALHVQPEVATITGLTFTEAEALLDWLESCGCGQLQISVGDGGVTVHCVCPPGRRLRRDEAGVVRLEGPD